MTAQAATAQVQTVKAQAVQVRERTVGSYWAVLCKCYDRHCRCLGCLVRVEPVLDQLELEHWVLAPANSPRKSSGRPL